MESIRVVLVFCVLAITASCASVYGDFPLKPCKANSTCSCTNVDGYYDLHPLANNNNTPHFTNVQDTRGTFSYSYNPCYGFDEGGSGCTDAAICQKDLQTGQYFALGYANSMVSISDSEYGLIFQYTAQTDKNRTAEIILQCDPSKEGELKFQNEGPPLYYYFNLYSKYACAEKPSTSGSTRPPTPAHHIHSDPKPGHHSRPPFRPTPTKPGRHSRHPRPTKHHGHHTNPTQDPTTSVPLKIFGWPAVTILLLGILMVLPQQDLLSNLRVVDLEDLSQPVDPGHDLGHQGEVTEENILDQGQGAEVEGIPALVPDHHHQNTGDVD
ncbi:hypothetical protein LOTGIDRAFT_168587, partial [Lottia gigantea]